ncbi:hypothetical protein [Myxacorys almedinensis]|nr:hypothetical protein [Myxacorys almedinensis]
MQILESDLNQGDSKMQASVCEVSEAAIVSMSETDLANWYLERGKRVIAHRDRFWEELLPGFYQPIHSLARLSVEQASCPVWFHWGFRSVLRQEDAEVGNGFLPVHLLTDVQNYTLERFSSNRRRHLKKCQKQVKIVQLLDAQPLREQGHDLIVSASHRTNYFRVPTQQEYVASLKNYIDSRRLVLAGFVNGKLGGYLAGYAVDGTAYFEDLYVATDVITTNINLGLIFEFVQICRRSGNVHEVVNGLHSLEDEQLCVFKDSIGFPAKQLPTRVGINAIARPLLRWKYPYKYYRLTGIDPQKDRFETANRLKDSES